MAVEAPEIAEAAATGAAKGTASTSTPKAPELNDDQSMTWELLLILGIVVLLISPIGNWLGSIVQEITTHHNVNLSLNPFQQDSTTQSGGSGGSGGGGGGNAAVGHYTVNLAGGGQMTVNASSPQAAVQNVSAEGGTPA